MDHFLLITFTFIDTTLIKRRMRMFVVLYMIKESAVTTFKDLYTCIIRLCLRLIDSSRKTKSRAFNSLRARRCIFIHFFEYIKDFLFCRLPHSSIYWDVCQRCSSFFQTTTLNSYSIFIKSIFYCLQMILILNYFDASRIKY